MMKACSHIATNASSGKFASIPNTRGFAFGKGNAVNYFLLGKMAEVERSEFAHVALRAKKTAARQ
jgi:hypothetical protein